MASENDERDKGIEDFLRAIRGREKTSRNPKGAGRPTKLEEEYKQFLEWRKLKDSGFSTRDISEIILGFGRHDEGRRDGHTKRKPPRIVGRVLEALNFKEKEIEKMKVDKIDKSIMDTAVYLAPYVMPSFVKPLGWALGLSALYFAEEIPKTDKYSLKEWGEMPQQVKEKYYESKQVGEEIFATRKLMYPIVHSLVEIISWLLEILGSYMSEEYGTNAIGLTRWMVDKPWRFALGPFAPITKFIQDRRQK